MKTVVEKRSLRRILVIALTCGLLHGLLMGLWEYHDEGTVAVRRILMSSLFFCACMGLVFRRKVTKIKE